MKKYNLINLKDQEICGYVILENGDRLIKMKIVDEYFNVIRKIVDETNESGFLKAKISGDLEISDSTGRFWLALKQNLIRYLDTVTEIAD